MGYLLPMRCAVPGVASDVGMIGTDGWAGTPRTGEMAVPPARTYLQSAAMALQIGPRLQAFFDEPLPIIMGTTRRDGTVQMHPLWYEYSDGLIVLNGRPARDWFKHLQRDGRASLLLIDSSRMFRWANIQARLVGTQKEG